MALSDSQILRIQRREGNWQADWECLAQELYAVVDAKTRNRRKYFWPCEDDRLDLISEMLVYYHERARAGTLLAAWHPNRGSPVAYLTGHVLEVRAKEFLAALAHRSGQPLREDERGNLIAESSGPDAAGDEQRPPVDFQHLVLRLPPGAEVDRVGEVAGLQLFPRLDWSAPGMERLREHLRACTAGLATAEYDALEGLARLHAQKQREFQAEEDRLRGLLYEQEPPPTPYQKRQLERRLLALEAERVFRPFDANTLAAILSVTRGNADQLGKRYREALPQLLSGLGGESGDASSEA